MTVVIAIPAEIERRLRRKAEAESRSMEQLALELLADALEDDAAFPSPEEVVARIKATRPEPGSLRPAGGSLADALRNAPTDPDFDLATWNQAWSDIAAEMRTTTRTNTLAEGRG